jgi:hypothetical protein
LPEKDILERRRLFLFNLIVVLRRLGGEVIFVKKSLMRVKQVENDF